MKFNNKVAVITGGSSGIGLATAKVLKARGASIVVCGRDRQRLDKAQQSLGDDTLVIQTDIAKLNEIDLLFEKTVEHFGKIDILFANAGEVKFMPMHLIDETLFDLITSNSFKSTFFTIQKALPYLNDNAAIIVNAATGQSMGFPGSTVAAANKAAIRSLARGVSADQLPTRGIRVNCISPGPIDTPLFNKLGLPEDQIAPMKDGFKQLIPLRRMGTAKEVAKVVAFLASSDSSFVIGEEIQVGGGEGNFRI